MRNRSELGQAASRTAAGLAHRSGLVPCRSGLRDAFARLGWWMILACLLMLGSARAASLGDAAAPSAVSGEQKFAILLVSFPSVPLLSAATPELYRDTYFGAGPSVDGFLRESSYGKAWASGQVFGPFVLDGDYFDQPLAVRDAALRAAGAAHIDLSSFNRLVLVVPQASAGLESGGLGNQESETIPLYPSGTMTASTTWLGDASAGSASERLHGACHEFGHNVGLRHARAADFGSDALGPVGQLPLPWDQIRDYGDSYSNMGRGTAHWAAPHKSALGWLQEGVGFKTVETDGTFVLQPYESQGATLKALRVRRGSGNNAWLWVEFRQAGVGVYDAGLPAGPNGALVHYEDAAWNDGEAHSNLLRMNPDSAGGAFFGNAILAAGNSWSDPYSNLTLALDPEAGSGLRVTLSYSAAPAIALSPSSVPVAAGGGQVTLNVSAPNGLAWNAAASAPWLAIAGDGSGTGSGQVVVNVAATPSANARWGKIAIGQAFAVIRQDGMAGHVSIAPAGAAFPASGGSGEIAVATDAADFAWTFSTNASWIQSVFFSRLTSVGPGTLRYIVAQNTGNAPRSGSIAIGAATFTITQAAGGALVSRLVWERLPTADAPISRLAMDMTAGPNGSVLFGGGWDGTRFGDTWLWDGSAWSARTPAHPPGARSGHAMAYDAARAQAILFGGFDGSVEGLSNATWSWDGTDWTQLHPQSSPGARANHAMAYDPVTHKTLLFGGNAGEADTWEWDGVNWSKKSLATAPLPRDGAAMAFDAARNEIVLFGGVRNLYQAQLPTFFNDTWIWDGRSWRQRITASAPSPRAGARIQYDPRLGQIVLVGGYGAKQAGVGSTASYVFDYREETWTWDGSNWTQQFPDKSPEFSYSYGMVFDTAQQRFFAHLGDDLHCADRGPRTYELKPGAGALLLAAYRSEVASGGGSGSIAISAAGPWNASADSWITLGSNAGSGSATLTYQIAPNPGAEPRSGKIVINDKVYVISQAGAPPQCQLIASPAVIQPGGQSTLTAICAPAADSYAWSGSGFAPTAASGVVAPGATTTYSVSGINANGTGNAASATVRVSSTPGPAGSAGLGPAILDFLLN